MANYSPGKLRRCNIWKTTSALACGQPMEQKNTKRNSTNAGSNENGVCERLGSQIMPLATTQCIWLHHCIILGGIGTQPVLLELSVRYHNNLCLLSRGQA